jgi:quinol-cytochrome oxidoreductase complex cytochrome b subunit
MSDSLRNVFQLEIMQINKLKRFFFRYGWPKTKKDDSLIITESLILHVHPAKVSKHAIKFSYTLWLGGLSLLLFLILVVSGLILMFFYTPYPEVAYRSMKDIDHVVSFGWLLRNIHRWSAHLMVISVFFHMCRVFYTAAYKVPREFNWVIGVFLLILTLGLSFTGYLLPWDQLAFWAITVGTSIASYAPLIGEKFKFLLLGGNIIGEGALLRFYVLHCLALPLFLTILVAFHIWRVRKDGGISKPPSTLQEQNPEITESIAGAFPASEKTYGLMAIGEGKQPIESREPEDTVSTWPHLLYRELLFSLIVISILLIFSVFFNAPLEEIANPSKTPNPAKAPWYFLGLQELVHYSAFWGGVVVPALVVILLIGIPYLDRTKTGVGIWFSRDRKLAIILFTLLMALIIIVTIIGTFFRGPDWAWIWPWQLAD